MKKIWIVACLLLIISSCYNDKSEKLYPTPSTTTCDTTSTIKYSTDIAPIVAANCAISGGCHSAADHTLSSYDYETSNTAFIGNALDGWIVSDINFTPTRGNNNMPKNAAKLPACDINKITRWVNEGAPNN